jgi:ATP/ADP translocase
MMEQSSRFLSLSGLSGILIGIYALAAAYYVHHLLKSSVLSDGFIMPAVIVAIVVLVVSVTTVLILTYRKTKNRGEKVWNKGTRLLVLNLMVPLVTGGLLTLIFIAKGYYGFVASLLLIFYGIALVNAAKYTRQELYYMGLFQIVLGIIAAISPAFSVLLWALGFGVVHIFYGAIMHFRYDHKSKNETS